MIIISEVRSREVVAIRSGRTNLRNAKLSRRLAGQGTDPANEADVRKRVPKIRSAGVVHNNCTHVQQGGVAATAASSHGNQGATRQTVRSPESPLQSNVCLKADHKTNTKPRIDAAVKGN